MFYYSTCLKFCVKGDTDDIAIKPYKLKDEFLIFFCPLKTPYLIYEFDLKGVWVSASLIQL